MDSGMRRGCSSSGAFGGLRGVYPTASHGWSAPGCSLAPILPFRASRATPPARARAGLTVDLSVVIPGRNVESTLAAQLDALLGQTWDGDWEIVVVDNLSTDGTAALVHQYATRAPRVRLVAASERAGLCYTRAAGVDAATGESIAICDGDDVVGPTWVASMGDALREHDCVTGPIEIDRLNPPWLAASRGRPDVTGCATWFGLFPLASGNNFGMRRELWETMGGFDERFVGAEDHELSLRLDLRGVRVQFAPGALVHYRYRDSARDLWRQGNVYGFPRPLLRRRVAEAGFTPPSRLAGWRSWAWLVAHLPDLTSRSGRARWLWVAGNRIGQVRGSIHHHTLFV